MGLALDRSGWMMSVVLVLNHVSPSAQTEELDHTTVAILKMWPYTAVVVVALVSSLHQLLHLHLLPPVVLIRYKFTLFHIKGKICVPSH